MKKVKNILLNNKYKKNKKSEKYFKKSFFVKTGHKTDILEFFIKIAVFLIAQSFYRRSVNDAVSLFNRFSDRISVFIEKGH